VIERHSVFGGTTDDVGGSGLAKHGTLVAGVIASQADGRDSVGIWPQARVISVRVFSGSGGGTTAAAVIAGLEKCRERGARVVNLSLSGLDQATAEELVELEDRMFLLRSTRQLNIVAGVGNNAGSVGYPARFASVLGVGAATTSGALCPFSNRGSGLDVSAPGCDVQLSWAGGGLGAGSGTSYATPIVSAVLAAIRAYRSDLSAEAAEQAVITSSPGGRLDAAATFRAVGLNSLVDVLPSGTPEGLGNQVRVGHPPAVRSLDALSDLGVRRPRVSVARYRRGLLEIRLAGLPDYARAVFRIDGRRHVRASGVLRLRLRRRPSRVAVCADVPGVGRTAPTLVHVRSARTPTRR
jgi:subtilisin family serine protease